MNKKKKNVFKKLKRIFVRLGKLIADEIKELWDKFMGLPKKVRYVIYIWLGVILLIVLLILASHNNSNFLNNYYNMESSMNEAALDYVNSYELYPTKDSKLKLDLSVLKDFNYIYEEEIADNSCEGFSIIYYNDIDEKYVVSSYVNCDRYTTKGFSDYK